VFRILLNKGRVFYITFKLVIVKNSLEAALKEKIKILVI
jgi:hypothetical protein